MLEFIIDLEDPYFEMGFIKMQETMKGNISSIINIELDSNIIRIAFNDGLIKRLETIFAYCSYFFVRDIIYVQFDYSRLELILKKVIENIKFTFETKNLILFVINFLSLFSTSPKCFSEIYFCQ